MRVIKKGGALEKRVILVIIQGWRVKIKMIRNPGQQQKKVMSRGGGGVGGGGLGQNNLTGSLYLFREGINQ